MVKIPYTLNVIVQLALIGWGFFFGGGGLQYLDDVCSSLFPQIRIVSIRRKISRKTHWPVFVAFYMSQPVE